MSFDPSPSGDAAFERRLLESARQDAQGREVQAAWARFAGALGLVVPDPGALCSVRTPVRAPAVAAAGVATRAAGGTAMKWLLVGALGGSGLTAALILGPSEPRSDAPPPVVERAPAPRSPAREAIPGSGPLISRPAAPAAPPETQKGSHPRRGGPRSLPSTLAAEVSRIDTARIASATGDHDEAMRLIERYHRDFPDGALAPDADVVALEAAAAKGDRAEVGRRAALFLSRYPSDPHGARVRWLAEH